MAEGLRLEERVGSGRLDLFGKKKEKGVVRHKKVTGPGLFLLITMELHGDILHLKK